MSNYNLGDHGSPNRMIDESPQMAAVGRELAEAKAEIAKLRQINRLERERLIRAGHALGSATASLYIVGQAEHLAILLSKECPP